MEQKFLSEPVGLHKQSEMFKYLVGEKPNFECHGERLVPSTQLFHGTCTFELELIVYPVCLACQTSSLELIAVSLPDPRTSALMYLLGLQ